MANVTELDVKIAEHVLDFRWVVAVRPYADRVKGARFLQPAFVALGEDMAPAKGDEPLDPNPYEWVYPYSSTIEGAWACVEELATRGYRFTLEELDVTPPWVATFSIPDIDGMGDPVHWYESGETAPLAIARAGLAAVRADAPGSREEGK